MLSIGKLAADQAKYYLDQAEMRVDVVQSVGGGAEDYYLGSARHAVGGSVRPRMSCGCEMKSAPTPSAACWTGATRETALNCGHRQAVLGSPVST